MSLHEPFPEFEAPPRDLTNQELDALMEDVIWPAATAFWGSDYRDIDKLEENEAVRKYIRAANTDTQGDTRFQVEASFFLEAQYQVDDNGEIDEASPADFYAVVSLESLHHGMTRIFRRESGRDEEVWEVNVFEFGWDGTPPLAGRYYVFKSPAEEDPDASPEEIEPPQEIEPPRWSHRHHKFLQNASRLHSFNPDRSADLNTQDAIDIRNILLALDTPEEVIMPISDK